MHDEMGLVIIQVIVFARIASRQLVKPGYYTDGKGVVIHINLILRSICLHPFGGSLQQYLSVYLYFWENYLQI